MNFISQLLENLKKERCIHHLETIFGGVELADMQLLSKFNKGSRFLLCVIDTYSKHAWVIPLKDKKGISIANAFQKILKESNRKPNKIWLTREVNFTITILKNDYEIIILKCIQHLMKENLLLLEDSLGH